MSAPVQAQHPAARTDDRELLTWLIVNHASFGTMGRLVEVRGGAPVWQDTVFVRRPCQHLLEWHCFDGADARAAIRVAMAAPPCAPDEEHGCSQSRSIREYGAETPRQIVEARNQVLVAEIARLTAYVGRLEHANSSLHVLLADEQRERELLTATVANAMGDLAGFLTKAQELRGRGTPRADVQPIADHAPHCGAAHPEYTNSTGSNHALGKA